MWVQRSTYTQPQHYEKVGWLVLCSAAFTPGENTPYSFYRRLSGPQDQSGHVGVKKNLHPSNTQDRTQAVQPIAKHLAAWATWSPSNNALLSINLQICFSVQIEILIKVQTVGISWSYKQFNSVVNIKGIIFWLMYFLIQQFSSS